MQGLKNRWVVSLMVLWVGGICLPIRAADEKKADATGTWKWTTQGFGGGNGMEQSAKLKQEGDKLTGTVSGRQNAPDSPIENGKITGNEISFAVTREFGGNKVVQKYSAKIDGDTLTGKIDSDFGGNPQSREWTAKREGGTASSDAKPMPAAKVEGTWQFKRQRDDGTEMKSQLKLKQDGDKITGVNTWNDGPDVPVENATVKGDTISFTITRERDGSKITTKYTGKVDGDKMVGQVQANINGEDRTFDITFDRIKE